MEEDMKGVPASPSGHSSETEPCSTVSAQSVSVPNAEEALSRLIAAIEFEVPAIRDGCDADKRLSILMKGAREARVSLLPDPEEPLESAIFLATDFGKLGRVQIVLPINNGGDEQFDADFEATLEYVRGVMHRRKEARAQAIEARSDATTQIGAAEGESAVAKPCAQDQAEDS